jgi:hypothetical protein
MYQAVKAMNYLRKRYTIEEKMKLGITLSIKEIGIFIAENARKKEIDVTDILSKLDDIQHKRIGPNFWIKREKYRQIGIAQERNVLSAEEGDALLRCEY